MWVASDRLLVALLQCQVLSKNPLSHIKQIISVSNEILTQGVKEKHLDYVAGHYVLVFAITIRPPH